MRSVFDGSIGTSCVTVQIPIYPDGRFHLLVHFEPALRSEFISIWTPQIPVPAAKVIV